MKAMPNNLTFNMLLLGQDKKVIKVHRNQTAEKDTVSERVLIVSCWF